MVVVRVMVRVNTRPTPKTSILTVDPNPQNWIVEGTH